MADERMIQEAVEAIENGQKDRARDLLSRVLKEEQNNVELWLYMSTVVDSQKERTFCLENALRIDPKNEAARRGMVMIGAAPPGDIKPVRPELERKVEGVDISFGDDDVDRAKVSLGRLIGIGAAGVVVVGLILFGIFGNPFGDDTPSYTIPTLDQAAQAALDTAEAETAAATLGTTEATAGAGAMLATPTFAGPTPLGLLLEATFTPTPRYVDTPHPDSGAFTSGMRAFEQGNFEDAVNRFQQHVEANPGDPDGRYYLGLSLLGLGEVLEAESSFLKAINVDPNFAPGYVGAARAALARDSYSGVGENLSTAIALDPDYLDAYLVRAEYFIIRENYEAAMGDLEIIAEMSPNNSAALFLEARIYFEQEMYPELLDAAIAVNQLDPTIIENHLYLGLALVEASEYEQAIGPLQTYLTFEPEYARGWLYLGIAQQALESHEYALTLLDRAKELDPELGEVEFYRGVSFLALGELEDALVHLNNAARLYPNWWEVQLYLGIGMYQEGRPGNAYNQIQSNQSLARTDEQKAALYYWRALCLEGLGDHENALSDWERLRELPTEAVPAEWLATANQYIAGVAVTPTVDESQPTRVMTVTPSPTP